jgi:hypothetical protein
MVPGHQVSHERLGRNTLRLLCSVLIRPITRVELSTLLDPSLFFDVLDRVVFEEISRLGAISSSRLRELLPGLITNRGFPDFDLTEFFGPGEVSEKQIEELFESTLRMIELRHREADPTVEN